MDSQGGPGGPQGAAVGALLDCRAAGGPPGAPTGSPWNHLGYPGRGRRIPGSGGGATTDPRGGTGGAWIRSLGLVRAAWEHLGSLRGTGGSQRGRPRAHREHRWRTLDSKGGSGRAEGVPAGARWELRGISLELEGRPWVHPVSIGGQPWVLRGPWCPRGSTLEAPWDFLGPPRGDARTSVGASGTPVDASGYTFGAPWGYLGAPGGTWGAHGTTLRSPWCHLGAPWENFALPCSWRTAGDAHGIAGGAWG